MASSTSSSHPSTPSNKQEPVFLQRDRALRWLRLALSALSFSLAAAVIGCEAAAFQHYKRTSRYERIWLVLWPLNLDTRATKALMAVGCVVAVLRAGYMVGEVIASPRSHIHRRRLTILAAITGISGFIASLVGLIFAIYLPGSTPPSGFSGVETIQSWTCRWKNGSATPAPAQFARDCAASQAGLVMAGVLVGLEAVISCVAMGGAWKEVRPWGPREKESPFDRT